MVACDARDAARTAEPMPRSHLTRCVVARCCLMAALVAPALVTAQARPTACVDKVKVTDFRVLPADSARPRVRAVTLTMKNLCGGTSADQVLNVPWRIT